jgi:DNA-binding MarR family transcriptional regulator
MKANPSTFTRFVDRMVDAGWLERRASPGSRREVLIDLTPHGAQIVDHVSDRRRRELDAIVSALPSDDRQVVLEGLQRFARAAGEPHADDLLVLGL